MDEIVFQSARFRVVRRGIDTGADEPMTKDFVLHPAATVILPITDQGKVVFVKNFRWVIDRDLLELPAGAVEPLEEPQACAARELEEETGFVAEKLEPLCKFYTAPGLCNELMHAFVGTQLKPGQQRLQVDEKISVEILGFDQIDQALRMGRIMDAKTIAALLYYQKFKSAERA